MRIKWKFVIAVWLLHLFFFASGGYSTTFDFASNNQEWTSSYWYEQWTFSPIGTLTQNPAPWSSSSGAIYAGVPSITTPSGADRYVVWQLTSPELSGDNQWQGISAIYFDAWTSGLAVPPDDYPVFIGLFLHFETTDGVQHHEGFGPSIQLADGYPVNLQEIQIPELRVPEGSTIHNVYFNIYFFDETPYGPLNVFVDNITPISAPVPEPATMLLLGSGLLGLVGLRKKFKR